MLTVRDGVEIVSREKIIRLISSSEMLGEVDCSNEELNQQMCL